MSKHDTDGMIAVLRTPNRAVRRELACNMLWPRQQVMSGCEPSCFPMRKYYSERTIMNFRLKHLAAGVIMLSATALAVPAMPVAADDDDFGAYLYETSCDELDTDDIIADVGDLDDESQDSEEWQRLGQGADFPSEFYAEDDGIDEIDSMDDLTSGTYAVAAHAEDSEDADVIACGDVQGEVQNDQLLIELDEVNDSGYAGRAHFAPADDEDENIEVTTGIWPAGEVGSLGIPEATPTS